MPHGPVICRQHHPWRAVTSILGGSSAGSQDAVQADFTAARFQLRPSMLDLWDPTVMSSRGSRRRVPSSSARLRHTVNAAIAAPSRDTEDVMRIWIPANLQRFTEPSEGRQRVLWRSSAIPLLVAYPLRRISRTKALRITSVGGAPSLSRRAAFGGDWRRRVRRSFARSISARRVTAVATPTPGFHTDHGRRSNVLDARRAPTPELNFRGRRGVQYAGYFDNAVPSIPSIRAALTPAAPDTRARTRTHTVSGASCQSTTRDVRQSMTTVGVRRLPSLQSTDVATGARR